MPKHSNALIKTCDRKDLTHLPFVSIDSQYTQDKDDAICLSNNKLYVAIADVAAYVAKGSKIDVLACASTSSMYFLGKTIHMLPKELSQKECSLSVGATKKVMVCEFPIMRNIIKPELGTVYEAHINIKSEITYEEAQQHIESSPKDTVGSMVYSLHKLFAKNPLKGLTFNRQSLDLKLSLKGRIEAINKTERMQSEQLIETAAVLTNSFIASWLKNHKYPVIYRNNSAPSEEKADQCLKHFKRYGVPIKRSKNKLKTYQNLSNKASNPVLQKLLLRSLNRAEYSTNEEGHFCLQEPYYSHFTSPIRRYPDLLMQRLVKNVLQQKQPSYTTKYLAQLTKHISDQTRLIDIATAYVEKLAKIDFLMRTKPITNAWLLKTIGNVSTVYLDEYGLEAKCCYSPNSTSFKVKFTDQSNLLDIYVESV